MKKTIIYFLAIMLISLSFSAGSYSQEKAKVRCSIALKYQKVNDTISLQVKLTYPGEKGDIPLPGEAIIFSAGSSPKTLGSAVTDADGQAEFKTGDRTKIEAGSDGSYIFRSEFAGKDSLDAANADVTVRDVKLEMTLSLVDTIKTITLKAFSTEGGRNIPVKGESVSLFVPRMFSNLKVGEIKLDESGTGKLEFPSDIPGDAEGKVIIIAGFMEHPSYGTVEARLAEKWGVPTSYSLPAIHRALWTKTPPMWMIITLSILLTGVWGHYMFAVISLILIKIDAKRKKAKDEYRL